MEYLFNLLKHVGNVIKLDHNTLLMLKSKFAPIYFNMDITKPLPGSLTVSCMESCLRVPIIYEGPHEVCPLCGGESHQLESCPKLPTTKKIEVFVEKFDASGIAKAQAPGSSSSHLTSNENWVTVSPKKKVKAMIHGTSK